jgi:hypothetical protein
MPGKVQRIHMIHTMFLSILEEGAVSNLDILHPVIYMSHALAETIST